MLMLPLVIKLTRKQLLLKLIVVKPTKILLQKIGSKVIAKPLKKPLNNNKYYSNKTSNSFKL